MLQGRIRNKILMKYFAAIIALLFSFPVSGQIPVNIDTFKIKEVIISRKKTSSGMLGFNLKDLDSAVLENYNHYNLAEMISSNSLIFVKSYGMGGTATTSIRGAGASQTQITWNEININNPMPGQSDLSLIPACFIDDVQIYYGGASMGLNSGGIGGIINLETSTNWKNETSVNINPGLGSFGRFSGSLKAKTGNTQFQSVTKAYFESAENNFRYLNSEISNEPVWETRKNSQLHQQGYLQELYFKKHTSVTSARIWYQSASRNLPVPMVVQQINSGEKQFDESLRSMLNYNTVRGMYKYSVTGALIINRLNYYNPLASIDSRNLSEKFTVKSVIETPLQLKSVLKITFNEELSFINSNNYEQNTSRNIINLTALLEKGRGERIGTTLLMREIINNKSFLFPDFTAGLAFRISEGKEYFLKGNLSRNSKVPDMNDIYWNPGGNSKLKNEYAYSGELSCQMTEEISSSLKTYLDVSLFRNTIRDMIQWHPGEFSYWTADNLQRVNSMGTESTVGLTYTLSKLIIDLKTRYSFTSAKSAVQTSSGEDVNKKQLMYIPENQSNSILQVWYGKFIFSWIMDFTGKRFISADNSKYLPGFVINSFKAGFTHDFKRNSVDLHLDVDNLFNTSYQVIAWHPMPGRSFKFGITLYLVK
jgi:vitamin B12 transporter